ncbi:ATP-binding protein [Sphingomonas sp. Mn802worker]|uniref:ATP-binding protein n=1 Tax=Sphingomonas sp. Mn802worker TaxID=629773 RepID=UPI00138ADBBF|nr:ATP-binding protein [Sphingomonas sp. Mn802worker]
MLNQAERRAISLDPTSGLQAEILLAKSGALIELGEIARALPALQQAHTLFTAQRDSRGEAKSLILLALMYDGARDRTAALRYFGQALEAHQADPGLLIAISNGRGMTLMALGQHGKAEQDFIQAYRLATKMHSTGMAAIALGNLANVRLLQGHLADAAQTIVEGATLSKTPDAAFARPTFLRLAAQSAFQRGNLVRARQLIDERFAGVDLTKTILTERDDHQTAYSIYAALGEDHLALQHLTALKRLDDQATEVARSNSAALAAARFDYANQELRIAKLKADELQATVAHEREQAQMQRTVFVVAAIGVSLVIGLLAFGMWTLRRSRDRLRVARDKVARALAVKTEFLAATSHEIRTPLNGILGMTEVMIADRQLDPATRDRLSVVHGAGVTMRALVDDILDVAKIETGKMTIEQAPLDLRRTIDEACRLWREQAEGKGLSFDVGIDACPGWIVGDAVRLRQIVFNLLSNAVKFTAVGSVTVAVTCTGERFQVTVTDTGIGIAPEAHDVIFDSFRQADAGTTRQFGGTGLGLSICRSLSRAMGGDVTVESALGQGARFTLDLPLIAAETPAGSEPAPAILLVVRSPITRAMLKALFEEHGDVMVAPDLTEACSLAASRPPQRILIEGDDTILAQPAVVAALVELTVAAPVAALTPVLSPDLRARLLASGVDAVIEKPVGKKVLVERVMNLERVLVRGAA